MASLGWFCGIVSQKEVSFVILLVQLRLVQFSRVSKVRVKIRVSVGIRVSFSDRVGTELPDVE